eukprot:1156201-Pelagomonas_calceolata.AAC.5
MHILRSARMQDGVEVMTMAASRSASEVTSFPCSVREAGLVRCSPLLSPKGSRASDSSPSHQRQLKNTRSLISKM